MLKLKSMTLFENLSEIQRGAEIKELGKKGREVSLVVQLVKTLNSETKLIN